MAKAAPSTAPSAASAPKIVDVRTDWALAEAIARWDHETWGAPGRSVADWLAEWAEAFLSHPDPWPVCFGARVSGAPAATASLVADDGLPPPYNAASGASPWVASVYTAPPFRGRGLARGLVSAVIARAAETGAERLWLYTGGAEPLYAALGFEAVSRATTDQGERVTVMRRGL